MVMHEQEKSIEYELRHLNEKLMYIDCDEQCIHAGPIIRGEHQYRYYDPAVRRELLKDMMYFIRHIDVNIDSVYIEKRKAADNVTASGQLAKVLSKYIREHYEYFNSFEMIKVYYDKGQIELNVILSTVFNTLFDNVEFKKVHPEDYRLFQVADVACTLKLIELKRDNHILSKSEITYFENERTLIKNYLKPIKKMGL